MLAEVALFHPTTGLSSDTTADVPVALAATGIRNAPTARAAADATLVTLFFNNFHS